VTETTRRGTAAPDDATDPVDEATAQLRVTGARLPGSLDPAATRPPATPATEVLSIHDLLDGPPEPALTRLPSEEAEPATVAEPVPMAVAEPVPADVPAAPAVPARTVARPPRQRSEVADRVRSDAAAAWDGARREVSDWLGRGDNALILGTLCVALLLLVVVAAVG